MTERTNNGALAADECPNCGARRMPPLTPGSVATARACQACGHIQEIDHGTGQPTTPPAASATPERRTPRYIGGMHADH
jgi:hypothetical protein